RDQGADRRLRHHRLRRSRRGPRGGRQAPGGADRLHRGATVRGGLRAEAQEAVAAAFRDEWGRIVAALIRRTGDWDLSEECAQEAFAQALRRWPLDGFGDRPGDWLSPGARNRAIDRLRRERRGAELLEQAASAETEVQAMDDDSDESGIEDDRL